MANRVTRNAVTEPAGLLLHTREIFVVPPQGGDDGTGKLSGIEEVTMAGSPNSKG